MLTTTLQRLRDNKACERGYNLIAAHVGVDFVGDIPLETILDNNGMADCIWSLRATDGGKEIAQEFTILCVMEVYFEPNWVAWAQGWLNGTDRSTAAADAAAYAARAVRTAVYAADAADATRTAAYAADAAYAAYDTAYSADAAYTAYTAYAAYAADAAADAAAYAADAVRAAVYAADAAYTARAAYVADAADAVRTAYAAYTVKQTNILRVLINQDVLASVFAL